MFFGLTPKCDFQRCRFGSPQQLSWKRWSPCHIRTTVFIRAAWTTSEFQVGLLYEYEICFEIHGVLKMVYTIWIIIKFCFNSSFMASFKNRRNENLWACLTPMLSYAIIQNYASFIWLIMQVSLTLFVYWSLYVSACQRKRQTTQHSNRLKQQLD